MTGPKILTFDVETSPIEAYVWGLWDQNIGIDFVKTDAGNKPIDWTILSYSAKWFGKPKVIFEHTGGRGVKKVRDDKPLMKGLRELLDEADLVIAQNGKKFDVRKVNARLIQHGIVPPSPYRVIDTMLVARKYFAFTSQKLAWTSKLLTNTPKDEHKKFPGFELWAECLKDNPAAWAEMEKYNKRDVRATEEVYKRLRPWIENHPNVGVYSDAEIALCPKCGSDKVQKRGVAVLQQGKYSRLQCMSCGGWSRSKEMLLPLTKRRSLLAPV
jgi:DNA polymerase elongation subunit (family B)